MRLPVQAIDSFQRGCLEDIDKIWAFMDNKTPEELRSRHSLRVLGGSRSTLYLSRDWLELQYTQMRPAGHVHNQEDGNANYLGAVARLDMIVSSTRVAAARVLRHLDDTMSYQPPQRPNTHIHASPTMNQHQATPSAHRDPPHTQGPLSLSGTASRAGHMSPDIGHSDQVAHMVTPGQGSKATVQITVTTRPTSMRTTKAATA